MWNNKSWRNYRSLFLLVRVRSGRFWFTLPLALFLIDETLEIFAGMLWLAEKFTPVKFSGRYSESDFERHRPQFKKFKQQGFSPRKIMELCRELLSELRRHGRYPLVEVETGQGSQKQKVFIELL
jgi:hypothetical protein